MKMQKQKIMSISESGKYTKWFVLVSIFGSTLSLSSKNWFVMWVGMEISTLSFTVILASNQGFPILVGSWKYLIFQSVGSLAVFLPLVVFKDMSESPVVQILALVGVGLKMSLVPFHGWLLHLTESSSLFLLFLLSSIQKIPSLVVAYNLYPQMGVWFYTMLVGSAMWGSLMGLGKVSVKLIVVCSSILMTSWMGFSINSWGVVSLLFLIYSIHLLFFVFSLKGFTFHSSISSLFSPLSTGSVNTMVDTLALGAILGLPPFGVFLMKMEVIDYLLSSESNFGALCLILCSGVMLFAYVKMVIPFFLQKSSGVESNSSSYPLKTLKGLVILVLLVFPVIIFVI